MDGLAVLRMIGGLGVVLGALAAALWLVRRYDIRLPGRSAGGDARRVALIERLPIDAKRSVLLLRRDRQEHLLLLAPEGNVVIETGIVDLTHRGPAARASKAAAMPPFAAVLKDRLAGIRPHPKASQATSHE